MMTRAHLLRAGLALALLASAACSRDGRSGGAGEGAPGDTSGGTAVGSAAPDSQPEPPRGNPDSVRAVIEDQRREAGIRDRPTPAIAKEPAPDRYAECMAQANAAPTADERAVLASTCKSYPDAPK